MAASNERCPPGRRCAWRWRGSARAPPPAAGVACRGTEARCAWAAQPKPYTGPPRAGAWLHLTAGTAQPAPQRALGARLARVQGWAAAHAITTRALPPLPLCPGPAFISLLAMESGSICMSRSARCWQSVLMRTRMREPSTQSKRSLKARFGACLAEVQPQALRAGRPARRPHGGCSIVIRQARLAVPPGTLLGDVVGAHLQQAAMGKRGQLAQMMCHSLAQRFWPTR